MDLARLSASASNLQPLRYALATEERICEQIFPCLGWAGYLRDWNGPEEGERPAAYVVILGDARINRNADCDLGIAAQSITLGARERGLAACMIGSIKRKKIQEVLAVGPEYTILLVIALGEPREEVVLEEVGVNGDVRYWRDAKGTHHVPKRRLSDIVINGQQC